MREYIGVTGPSRFSPNLYECLEEYCGFNYIELSQKKPENLFKHLDHCKAVILAGGTDIHPQVYGSMFSPEQSMQVLGRVRYGKFDLPRDILEIRVIDYCLKNDIPLLGICRGHQMLGVYNKLGFLPEIANSPISHSPGSAGFKIFANTPDANKFPMHTVFFCSNLVPKMLERKELDELLKTNVCTRVLVNSFHHQAIPYQKFRAEYSEKNQGKSYAEKGIRVIGRSVVDIPKTKHIIEYMASVKNKWFSVQWHPEFDYNVSSASRYVMNVFKIMVQQNCKHDEALDILYKNNPDAFHVIDQKVAVVSSGKKKEIAGVIEDSE